MIWRKSMNVIKYGNLTMARINDDATFKCTICGNEETVQDFENGKSPHKFAFLVTNETESTECYKCGEKYSNDVGRRYR
jgi:hypothetical protein